MTDGELGNPNPWTARNGEPVSREKPHGAVAVVVRRAPGGLEVLLLHRAVHPPDFDGDWAWGPPAGVRRPGEDPGACAARELLEETGLSTVLTPAPFDEDAFAVFAGEVDGAADVSLSDEHDAYAWVGVDEARRRCAPAVVVAELDAGLAAILGLA